MPVDIVIEAEDYSSSTAPKPPFAWTLETDVQGYSAAGFMHLGPSDGNACTTPSAFDTCAASLVYDVTIPADATFYFHARTFATSSSNDSLWYGVDGTVVMPDVGCAQDATWHWRSGGSHVLPAGAHTITIWQRESGVRLDQIALTLAANPPP